MSDPHPLLLWFAVIVYGAYGLYIIFDFGVRAWLKWRDYRRNRHFVNDGFGKSKQ